jgi:hypothetical protein
MKPILIAVSLLTAGCALSNQEVVRQTKYCKDNGMTVEVLRVFGDGQITSVQCVPK